MKLGPFSRSHIFLIGLILLCNIVFAGQTGKLAGKIFDKETGEPVIGANIIIDGTHLGAAADIDGYYYINNIHPGEYTISVSAVGYKKTIVRQVGIRIDLTTTLDVELYSEAVQLGEDVVVIAERPLITKDLTSTSATVTSKEIEMMPVDNIGQVINLQAGVVGGHFRGGRSNEVAYLIDGLPVTDAFSGQNSVEVENSSVRELEVISGTFNAEYGQALSGVVNIVTKEGSQNFEGYASAYLGDFVATNDGIFENLDNISPLSVKDFQFSLSGPTKILNSLTFFVTGRYYESEGYMYGRRVYKPSDSNPFFPSGISWEQTPKDAEFVPMNPYSRYSLNGKLTYALPDWKFSYSIFFDEDESKGYNHGYRWTPDGTMNHYGDNLVHNFQMSFVPSQNTFTSLKFAANKHRFYGYLYEDQLDSRYVEPSQGIPTSSYTYRHGGNEVGRYNRFTKTYIGQWTFESQVSKEHKVKLGIEGRSIKIFNHSKELVNVMEGFLDDDLNPIVELDYPLPHSRGNQSYYKEPYEYNAYIQDKMEYDIMVINAGVRFEYFNPNSSIPADKRNPLNNPDFPGYNERVSPEAKMQISPRLGVSFPISDQGAIYFSYGHFFQIPPLENLYSNDELLLTPGQSLSSFTGNPDLKPQKTVQYELGLQQVIFPNLALDITVYYRDIRNLLGMEILSTYETIKYARFINRDYGNTKGFIVTLDKRFADYFSAKVDYTFQLAEGNASDPMSVYNDTRGNVESEKHLVPLDWDQRSTLNISGNVGVPGDWTIGIIYQYGSGMPYTEDIRISNGVRFENSGIRPTFHALDLKADKFFDFYGLKFHTYLLVYNLLDIRNEFGVYGTTGRANADLDMILYTGEIIGLNTKEEYIKNPGMYSSPREVRVGLSVGF
ncbi:MAG: TonB-dependent receptor [Bacteroidetes bacterium]|nr:TonB-dependent receptor [Bacteroidota bacterium]